ncbi:MAG TPA: hypothetical protein DHV48_09275 [Prolixibacteraceae bacterium]|nr:hypothetical protein [Prolixibacteraceae bacterium]
MNNFKFNIMKNLSVLITGLLLIFYCITGFCSTTDNPQGTQQNSTDEKTLNIVSSPELNSLATNLATEYERLNPSVKINIGHITDNQIIAGNNISFISESNSETVNNETVWKMAIGRDAIVTVINAKNPMLNEINRQGLTVEDFALLLANSGKTSWNSLIEGGSNTTVNYYFIDNEPVISDFASFSKSDLSAINGSSVANPSDLISAVQKDIYAIGFCKLTDVRDAAANEIVAKIKLLPIDKNRNGRIDNFENFYGNLNAFTRAAWVGKYPRELCGGIYAAAPSKPTDNNTIAFLTWVMADGQKFMNKNGYSILASSEISSNLETFASTEATTTVIEKPVESKTWAYILIVLGVIALLFAGAVGYFRKNRSSLLDEDISFTPAFDENSIIAPQGLYFDKTHTWAFMEKDGMVKIGIDDFLQHITGTISRIRMKEPGEMVRKGEKILTIIKDGKQLNIYSPISGTIREQNQKLNLDSSIINSSPFADGWVYTVEPKNWLREIQFLFMGENYKEWLQDEFARLKDFFASSMKSSQAVYAHIVLQDGGELTDNVLADFGPEVWEDFQTKFIDTSK